MYKRQCQLSGICHAGEDGKRVFQSLADSTFDVVIRHLCISEMCIRDSLSPVSFWKVNLTAIGIYNNYGWTEQGQKMKNRMFTPIFGCMKQFAFTSVWLSLIHI